MRDRYKESSYAEQRFYLFYVVNKLKDILIMNQRDIESNPKTQQQIENSMDRLRRSFDSIKREKCPEFQKTLQSCWSLRESSDSYIGQGFSHAPALVLGEAFLDLSRYVYRDYAGKILGILDACFPMLLDQTMVRLPLVLGLEEYDSLLIRCDSNTGHICQDAVISIGLRAMQTMGFDRYEYYLAENANTDGVNLFRNLLADSSKDDDSPYFDIFGNQRKARDVTGRLADGLLRAMGMNKNYDDGKNENTMVLWSPNCRLTRSQEDDLLDSLDKKKIQTLVVGQDQRNISYEGDYDMVLTLSQSGGRYRIVVRKPMSYQKDVKDVKLNNWYVRLYKRPGRPDISSLHYYKDGI